MTEFSLSQYHATNCRSLAKPPQGVCVANFAILCLPCLQRTSEKPRSCISPVQHVLDTDVDEGFFFVVSFVSNTTSIRGVALDPRTPTSVTHELGTVLNGRRLFEEEKELKRFLLLGSQLFSCYGLLFKVFAFLAGSWWAEFIAHNIDEYPAESSNLNWTDYLQRMSSPLLLWSSPQLRG